MQRPPDPPTAPAHLTPAGRAAWTAVTAVLLAEQRLDPAMELVIERYASAIGTWRMAQEHLSQDGVIIKAAVTGVPQVNPWAGIARQAAADAARIERALGLTPRHRILPFEMPARGGR